MKYEQINKIFSDMVAEQLAKGCTIESRYMRGFQSNIEARLFFRTKENKLLAVFIENIYHGSKEKFIVKKGLYTKEERKGCYDTIWMDDFDCDVVKTFIKVGEDWYVEEDEFERIQEIKKHRRQDLEYKSKTKVPVRKAWNVLKNKKCLNGIKLRDVAEAWISHDTLYSGHICHSVNIKTFTGIYQDYSINDNKVRG